ncbi:hypothetical protein C3R30_21995, partial [Mycobacterium tuberculosis]
MMKPKGEGSEKGPTERAGRGGNHNTRGGGDAPGRAAERGERGGRARGTPGEQQRGADTTSEQQREEA